ncbi:MAG: zinc-dependent alcohol dehydrogenase, partial [Chloroflexota bacterium]
MRALAKVDTLPGHVEVIDVPVPTPASGEVLIKVLACGLCGTDMTLYKFPAELAQQMGIQFPIVFGHEFGGRVAGLGAGVEGLPVGTLVTVNPHLYCKECLYCRSDRHEICLNRPIVGYNRPGGFAEYVAVRAENVYRLEEHVPPVLAAVAEPLAIGHHMAARSGTGPGSLTVVFGPGPIGLVTAIGCQAAGAERVLVVGLPEDEERLAIARRWGMETYHAGAPALVETLRDATGGLGPESVFEVSGSAAALRQALQLVRKDGTVYAVGIPGKDVPLDLAAMVFAEKRLVGCRGYRPQDWVSAAALINARSHDLMPLVSDVLPLDQHERAFAKALSKEGIRIVIDP